MNKSQKFLTVSTASNQFNLKPSLIYHWLRGKKFRYYKIEKKVLFKEIDFINFINLHSIPNIEDLEDE